MVYLINIGLPYTKAIVNHIGYRRIPVRAKGEVVKFRANWNRGVLDSPICFIGILLIALLGLRDHPMYDSVLKYLGRYLESK